MVDFALVFVPTQAKNLAGGGGDRTPGCGTP